MGAKGKKEYQILLGKPVLAHSALPFLLSELFSHIVVTVPPSHIPEVEALLEPHLNLSAITFVEGGDTRQQSVYLGLLELEKVTPEYVLIHDGARPWIDDKTIRRVLEGARKKGACLPVVKTCEAIKEVGEDGFIERHLGRASTVRAQTPQGFLFSHILKAHRRAQEVNRVFIDDGEVYAEFVGPVFTVVGNASNRKITYPYDLDLMGQDLMDQDLRDEGPRDEGPRDQGPRDLGPKVPEQNPS
jgi:2-C-methyl-D-erythritol 4-phosphate cytidylyltransferase